MAPVQAENALLLQWKRAMKKDPTFKKVVETQKELKDSEGFDWLESTELAIDKRKFLLNRLYEKQPIPLVSFVAVFWMSRNAPLRSFGGALRDIQKTAARETTHSTRSRLYLL